MKKLLTILMLLCCVGAWGQSFEELKRKAEAGDANAQCDLGYKYEKGDGVAQDYDEAVWWYRKSAEQGDKYGQYNLGICYYFVKGVTQDYNKAVEWCRKSAEQGLDGAQNILGICYYNGQGVTKDYAKAVEWYSKAAAQGNMYAYYNLGLCYQYGNGVSKDLYKAKEYYEMVEAKVFPNLTAKLAEVKQEIDAENARNYSKASTNSTPASSFINGHEYVDLGLPSGLKWATCNVGASKPDEYGSYFAWGETKTKSEFSHENSFTHGKTIAELKSAGIIGSNGVLTPNYDAAHANWGGTWRMPTLDEIGELKDNTTTEWTKLNGVYGTKVTSKKNGKYIFLPAAGYHSGQHYRDYGEHGNYWSSSPFEVGNNPNPLFLDFSSSYFGWLFISVSFGYSIRPVSE